MKIFTNLFRSFFRCNYILIVSSLLALSNSPSSVAQKLPPQLNPEVSTEAIYTICKFQLTVTVLFWQQRDEGKLTKDFLNEPLTEDLLFPNRALSAIRREKVKNDSHPLAFSP